MFARSLGLPRCRVMGRGAAFCPPPGAKLLCGPPPQLWALCTVTPTGNNLELVGPENATKPLPLGSLAESITLWAKNTRHVFMDVYVRETQEKRAARSLRTEHAHSR